MKARRTLLAVAMLAAPLVVSPGAEAANQNTCTTSGTQPTTSFTATCTASPVNANTGTYAFTINWSGFPGSVVVNPCLANTPIIGTVGGNGPGAGNTITDGTALAVLDAGGGAGNLNLGFRMATASATGRQSAFFRFTCIAGNAIVQAGGGYVSEVDAVSAIPSAPHSAYCPYGSISGTGTYSPPAGLSSTTPALTMNLVMQCIGAVGAQGAGTYTITSAIHEQNSSCLNAFGAGTISGTGPSGAVSGAWAYERRTVHYFGFTPDGTGYITMNGKSYYLYLWLDIVPPPNGACPLAAGTMAGHALVVAV